jgi:hypothetical protein
MNKDLVMKMLDPENPPKTPVSKMIPLRKDINMLNLWQWML